MNSIIGTWIAISFMAMPSLKPVAEKPSVVAALVGYSHPLDRPGVEKTARTAPPQMDVVTVCGFFVAVLLLICYGHESYGLRFTFGCAVAGVFAAVYGILQGAWPLSIVEAVWAVAAARRWYAGIRDPRRAALATSSRYRSEPSATETSGVSDWRTESRLTRLFGTK